MSTHGSFKGWGTNEREGDEKLLKFLYENKHYSPFEFAGMVIEVHAPIAVFREWHRHRTQSYNEASARYAPLPDVDYVPTTERILLNSKEGGANKQAGAVKGSEALTEQAAADFRAALEDAYDHAQQLYSKALGAGVPKELARLVLPVGRYSKMRAQANLRNWLTFLTLRMDPAAQWEIRQYAGVVGTFIARNFPHTWALFELGRMR
jgi:thymidylate synthase (FAD)